MRSLHSIRRTAQGCGAALLGLVLLGCGNGDRPREVRHMRTVTAEPAPPVSSAERFGFVQNAADHGGAMGSGAPAPDHADGGAGLVWQLPPGWQELPPTPMRAASFRVTAAPEIDCSISTLGSGGGGVGPNLNRWRKQMTLGDLDPMELQRLPTRPVLGEQAVLLECDGVYKGMGQIAPHPGWKLLGMALEHGGQAIFVKMVGPAADMQRERAHFEALCQSLRSAPGGGAAADGGAAASMPDAASGSPDAEHLSWNAPPSWVRTGERPMRLVSFALGHDKSTDCYVSVLAGAAGGLEANINRWYSQMGQPELSSAQITALPAIPMLGQQGRFVRIRGHFTGMDGAPHANSMLLGALCLLPAQSVFVKMVGPEADVTAEEAHFKAFCKSLR
jgi:hypothetical protein